jgi:hypothetical protein
MTERKQFVPDPDEVGSIWKKEGKKGPFYTLEINMEKFMASGGKFTIFPLDNPRGPVARIKVNNYGRQDGSVPRDGGRNPQSVPRFDDIPPISDNDIPF